MSAFRPGYSYLYSLADILHIMTTSSRCSSHHCEDNTIPSFWKGNQSKDANLQTAARCSLWMLWLGMQFFRHFTLHFLATSRFVMHVNSIPVDDAVFMVTTSAVTPSGSSANC